MSTGTLTRPSPRLRNCSVPDEVEFHSLYFCNRSNWGVSAKALVEAKAHDAIVICETHVLPENSNDMLNHFDRHHWTVCASPAHATPSVHAAGGVVMGVKKRFAVSSYRHLALKASQAIGLREHGPKKWTPGPLDLEDISVLSWKLRRVPLLVVGMYLDASIGLRGNNIRKLCTLASIVKDHAGPWIAVGDWNNGPWQLEEEGWLSKLEAQVRVPENSGHTCTAGPGRLLEYVVCSHSAAALIRRVYADD